MDSRLRFKTSVVSTAYLGHDLHLSLHPSITFFCLFKTSSRACAMTHGQCVTLASECHDSPYCCRWQKIVLHCRQCSYPPKVHNRIGPRRIYGLYAEAAIAASSQGVQGKNGVSLGEKGATVAGGAGPMAFLLGHIIDVILLLELPQLRPRVTYGQLILDNSMPKCIMLVQLL